MECSASWSVQKSARSDLIWKLTVYVGINMNSLSFIKAISVTWFLIRVMLFMQTVSRNMLGKDWRQKEEGAAKDEMASSITDSMDMNLSKLWKIMKDREVWYAAVHGVTKSRTRLGDWTTTNRAVDKKEKASFFWSLKLVREKSSKQTYNWHYIR